MQRTKRVNMSESEWLLQSIGLLGRLRDAWILQGDEVMKADSIERFVRETLPSIIATSKLPISAHPLVRRDIYDGHLHEVVFSAKPLPFTDAELFLDNVRREVLNYPQGLEDVVAAERAGETTYSLSVAGRLASTWYTLMLFRCTAARKEQCRSFAGDLATKWGKLIPAASFRVEEFEHLSSYGILRKLKTSQITKDEMSELYNVMWNAGIDLEEPRREELTDFQRGVVWALVSFAHRDPIQSIWGELSEAQQAALGKAMTSSFARILRVLNDD